MSDLRIFEGPRQLEEALADVFVSGAQSSIEERGAFSVALSGGSTPKSAYELLARPERRDAVDWTRVLVYFGDERCVPPDDTESNYRMASEAFLSRVPLPPGNVFRMRGEDDPPAAASAYAQQLVERLGRPPRFDLVLLGMGPDGHTASLFPGSDPRLNEDELVRAVYVEKLHAHRLTLTPLVINNARHVAIAVSGLPKAPAVYAVLRGPHDPVTHPIQIVSPVAGTLTWLLDKAAAAQL